MTQQQRILTLLRAAGEKGVPMGAFTSDPAIDGGKPILALTARMSDLREKGYDITQKDAVFFLHGEKATKSRRRRKKTRAGTAAKPMSHTRRIAEYKKAEKAAGSSASSYWIQRRSRVVELSRDLRRMEPMLFWNAVSDDELEAVFDEVQDLAEYAARLAATLDANRANASLREKIANLRNTRGRTIPEAESARNLADKLERRLDDDGGRLAS